MITRLALCVLMGAVPTAVARADRPGSTPEPIRLVAHMRAKLVLKAPPPSSGPHPAQTSVSFRDSRHGLLSTQPAETVGPSRGLGRIQRTDDGGRTWTTVWSRRSTAVTWIGFRDRAHAFAAAVLMSGTGEPSSALFLSSTDGGSTWKAARPRLPKLKTPFFSWPALDFQFVSRRVGFATVEPYIPGAGGPLLRTLDGGRRWSVLRTPFAPSSVHFVNASLGYASGVTRSRRCPDEIFRTDDGGTSWHALPASCRRYDLWAIDVLDDAHIFVGGGQGYWAADDPRQAVLTSSDGGRSWRTIYNARTGMATHPIVDLRFADARRGWAITGSCKMGANGPCGGTVLVTSDGGRSWRDTRRAGVRLATTGTRHAWTTGGEYATVVSRSADGGRSWQSLVRPEGLNVRTVEAAGKSLVASSVVGFLRSVDGGRSWSRLELPKIDPELPFVIRPELVATPDRDHPGALELSRDGGRTWTSTTVVAGGTRAIDAIAFADDAHGLVAGEGEGCVKGGAVRAAPIYTTHNGGRTWRHEADLPLDVDGLAVAGKLAVASGFGAAPCSAEVVVSGDRGRNWRVQRLPRGLYCGDPAISPPQTILLSCSSGLLLSRDGGSTWAKELTPKAALGSLSAAGGHIWAAGPRYGRAGPALWRSDDLGRAWVEVWPRPPKG